MNKKGFTLIELLAVIIIISIIALITIPKISSQVEDSKKSIAKTSALNYKKGVSEYIYYQEMKQNYLDLNGRYYINDDGYLYNNNKTLELSFDGQKPTNGNLTYINNELTSGCLTINKYKVIFQNGEVSNIEKGTCEYNENQSIPEIVTSGDGLYESSTDPGRLIYRGTNPDNYIWLDEDGDEEKTSGELYRIVSYETDGTIKVVRNESIGKMAWDERDEEDTTTGPRHNSNNTYCNYDTDSENPYEGCNVWGNTNNTYYNGNKIGTTFKYKYYENSTSNTLTDSTNTGTVTENSTLNTYLNETWIDTLDFKDNIDNHSFNVGGLYYYNRLIDGYTGGDKGINKEKSEEKLYTWKGKIGLLNITEFKETSTNSSCTSIWSNYYANFEHQGWPCSINNWTLKPYIQVTLTPATYNQSFIWNVQTAGYFNYGNAATKLDTHPAFYLKSSVNITGSGTESNPYQIEAL